MSTHSARTDNWTHAWCWWSNAEKEFILQNKDPTAIFSHFKSTSKGKVEPQATAKFLNLQHLALRLDITSCVSQLIERLDELTSLRSVEIGVAEDSHVDVAAAIPHQVEAVKLYGCVFALNPLLFSSLASEGRNITVLELSQRPNHSCGRISQLCVHIGELIHLKIFILSRRINYRLDGTFYSSLCKLPALFSVIGVEFDDLKEIPTSVKYRTFLLGNDCRSYQGKEPLQILWLRSSVEPGKWIRCQVVFSESWHRAYASGYFHCNHTVENLRPILNCMESIYKSLLASLMAWAKKRHIVLVTMILCSGVVRPQQSPTALG